MIKEQRRMNEKLRENVTEMKADCIKQNNLTERIQAFEVKRTETQLTLNYNFEGGVSIFNPAASTSINQ